MNFLSNQTFLLVGNLEDYQTLDEHCEPLEGTTESFVIPGHTHVSKLVQSFLYLHADALDAQSIPISCFGPQSTSQEIIHSHTHKHNIRENCLQLQQARSCSHRLSDLVELVGQLWTECMIKSKVTHIVCFCTAKELDSIQTILWSGLERYGMQKETSDQQFYTIDRALHVDFLVVDYITSIPSHEHKCFVSNPESESGSSLINQQSKMVSCSVGILPVYITSSPIELAAIIALRRSLRVVNIHTDTLRSETSIHDETQEESLNASVIMGHSVSMETYERNRHLNNTSLMYTLRWHKNIISCVSMLESVQYDAACLDGRDISSVVQSIVRQQDLSPIRQWNPTVYVSLKYIPPSQWLANTANTIHSQIEAQNHTSIPIISSEHLSELINNTIDPFDFPAKSIAYAALVPASTDSTDALLKQMSIGEAIQLLNEDDTMAGILLQHISGRVTFHETNPHPIDMFVATSLKNDTSHHMDLQLARICSLPITRTNMHDIRLSAMMHLVVNSMLGHPSLNSDTHSHTDSKNPAHTNQQYPTTLFDAVFGPQISRQGIPCAGRITAPTVKTISRSFFSNPLGPLSANAVKYEHEFTIRPGLLDVVPHTTESNVPNPHVQGKTSELTMVQMIDFEHTIMYAWTPCILERLTRIFPLKHSSDIYWGSPMKESEGIITQALSDVFDTAESCIAAFQTNTETNEKTTDLNRRTRRGRTVRASVNLSDTYNPDDEIDEYDCSQLIRDTQTETAYVFDVLIRDSIPNDVADQILKRIEKLHDTILAKHLPPVTSLLSMYRKTEFYGISLEDYATAGWSNAQLGKSADGTIKYPYAPTVTRLWATFISHCKQFMRQSPGHNRLVSNIMRIGEDYVHTGNQVSPTDDTNFSAQRGAGGPPILPIQWRGEDGSGRANVMVKATQQNAKSKRSKRARTS